MFEGFHELNIVANNVRLRGRIGPDPHKPPLLLLHGHPESHMMWHRVAPELARDFFVVVPDLRGYGDSQRPAASSDHAAYSKREMARDCLALMEQLGHKRFSVAGHDRGGRVAARLAADAPDRVSKAMLLDIAPTLEHVRGNHPGLCFRILALVLSHSTVSDARNADRWKPTCLHRRCHGRQTRRARPFPAGSTLALHIRI